MLWPQAVNIMIDNWLQKKCASSLMYEKDSEREEVQTHILYIIYTYSVMSDIFIPYCPFLILQ